MQIFEIEKRETRIVTRRFHVEAESEEDAIDMVQSRQVDEDPVYTTEDGPEEEFFCLKEGDDMGGTDLMVVEYIRVAEKISKSFVDFMADFMDSNGIDGYCGWLDKDDKDFREALEEHTAEHPEDARRAQALLRAIDASGVGIEVRFFDH